MAVANLPKRTKSSTTPWLKGMRRQNLDLDGLNTEQGILMYLRKQALPWGLSRQCPDLKSCLPVSRRVMMSAWPAIGAASDSDAQHTQACNLEMCPTAASKLWIRSGS
jgi:hypothetical protein